MGAAIFSSTCTELELAAPGFGINSTVPGGGTGFKYGTSMASPHVAGAAAVLWGSSPSSTNSEVRSTLQATAIDLGSVVGRDTWFGFGLVDLDQAISSLAVTLSYFEATRDGNVTHFNWATSTETANIGFNLYVTTADGLIQINRKLVPSHAVDSLVPQFYNLSVGGLNGDTFYVEDVDTRGQGVIHGPFTLGEAFGTLPSADPINWPAIQAEHQSQAQGRAAASRAAAANRSAVAQQAMQSSQPFDFPVFELRVDHDALYRVTYEQLAAVGLDLNGVPASMLALTTQGESVPIDVQGAGQFGPGSSFVFYGKGLDTLYTDTNVYRLYVGAALAERASSVQGQPRNKDSIAPFYMETTTLDEDKEYFFASPLDNPWYDTRMLVFDTPNAWNFDLAVDNFVGDVAPVSLNVSMYGVTNFRDYDPDHHVEVSFNGSMLVDEWFDGLIDQPVDALLPPGTLQEGGNTLTFSMPADTGAKFDLVNFNSASITYPRAFVARDGALAFAAIGEAFQVDNLPSGDVLVYRISGNETAALMGVQVSQDGGTYSATFRGTDEQALYVVSTIGALSTPTITPMPRVADITSGQADLVIISHPNFIEGLEPLVAAREAQGLSVRMVNVEDIYSQFGAGIFGAQSIRDYIVTVQPTMNFRYVLLVGGDTYDYRDYQGAGSLSFLPTLYAATDESISYAPTDPLFADVNYDNVPDLALGRFPVRTVADLDAMVNMTLAYDAKAYGGTAVFAADFADGSVSFSDISDGFIEQVPDSWTVSRAYLDDAGVAPARTTLLEVINDGVALTSFVGHSGPTQWTSARLFGSADASALSNAGRPSVVVQFGCWNTYFVAPSNDTLGHKLLLEGDRGAAMVIGSTTLSYVESQTALGNVMMPLLTQKGMRVGDAMMQAKQALAATNPEMLDVILGWTILGDPTVMIAP